jgi:hypothetical protein
MKTHIDQYVMVEDFVELFEWSKKTNDDDLDQLSSKAEYLMSLIDFHTYDAGLDAFFMDKITEVLEALLNRTTFDFIGKSHDNNKWYTIVLHLPFFIDGVNWGTSIRGAWLDTDHRTGVVKIDTTKVMVGEKQVLKFELDCDRWKAFCQAMIDFYRKPDATISDQTN